MRAVAKILRARASEHPCNICEQFEQRPNFASTFKLNKTHMCVNLGFFPGISSCKRQKVDIIKSQLSFVDCFTAQA